jgi:cytochrome c oxidase subunit 2
MIGLVGVVVMVSTLLFLTSSHFGTNLLPWKLYHGGVLEMIYTIIPARRVLRIGLVSFDLLYGGGELQAQETMATVKVIGRQWYWSYEYSCLPRWESAVSRAEIQPETVRFDAYLLPASEGTKRMLDTDQRVVIPRHASVRMRVTSSDVIHSWRVPSLGVKVDRVPGRLNETIVHVRREGVFYGQCSELCGSGHGFMPIVVEAVSPRSFRMWILGLLQPAKA